MTRRVTIVDIAARVGVHFTTVALALKGSPRVKAATRDKVRAMAQEMGYVPDPMLSAFSAYRKAQKPVNYRETLAWVTTYPTQDGWRLGAFKVFHQGAEKRAAELGYRLEQFWLKEPGMSPKRATTVLSSRGVRGLLIAPLPTAHGHLNLDWNLFSSVTFGFTLMRPRLHTVITTHYQDVITAIRHLKTLGHHYLGWANSRKVDERVSRQWKAGFWSEMQALPPERQIPLFSSDPFEKREFLAWFERYHPDAILTSDPHQCGALILKWLKEAGYSVPKDVSVVAVNIQEEGIFSGMKEPSLQIGEAAVDLLSNLIRDGKSGLPEYPSRLLIDGTWIEGQTVARRLGIKRLR